MKITLLYMSKQYRGVKHLGPEKEECLTNLLDDDKKEISVKNPPFTKTNYFSILERLSELGHDVKYIMFTSKEWMNRFCHGDNVFHINYKDVGLYYTHNLEYVNDIVNSADISIVRGNNSQWNSIIATVKGHVIFLPCWSNITYDNMNIKVPDINKFIVFADDENNMSSFIRNNIKCQLFKKPAPKAFYLNQKNIEKDIDLLFICRNTDRPHKRFDMFLSFLPDLDKRIKKIFNIHILGIVESHRSKIDQLKKQLKNINLVTPGKNGRDQIINMLDRSKASLCMSDWDANPRTISESLARNVPVICGHDLKGGKFQIIPGINGEIFNSNKSSDFCDQIIKCVNNYDKYNSFKNCFTIDDTCEQILRSKYE